MPCGSHPQAARVIVAMSGGVDSSAAAALLVRQGFEVIGITMRLWTPELACDPAEAEERYGGCCGLTAVEDARKVCGRLGVPHYVLNLKEEFRRLVVEPFIEEYRRGRTPNPCIACNEHIKFHALLDRAEALGAQLIATGHHARVVHSPREPARLLCGRDKRKDQAYFLYRFTQDQLRRVLMPVGEMTKADARAIVGDLVPRMYDKPESQDVCFVPDGDYRRFIREHGGPSAPGEIVHVDGRVLGRHDGVEQFTLGQRKGLGLSVGRPLFVVDIDPAAARVIVGEPAHLVRRFVRVGNLSWISGHPPEGEGPYRVKLRYNSIGGDAILDAGEPGSTVLRFGSPQRAPAPGQAAVVYDGDEVLGGGTIEGAWA